MDAETGSEKGVHNWSKTEAKWSQNESHKSSIFWKYKKKCIQKSMRKKGAERVGIYNRTPASRRSILGRRGRDLGRGRLVQFGFRFVSNYLTRPAPSGCGGSKMAPKSSFGHPGIRFLRFWEDSIEVRFLMIFWAAPKIEKIWKKEAEVWKEVFGSKGRRKTQGPRRAFGVCKVKSRQSL